MGRGDRKRPLIVGNAIRTQMGSSGNAKKEGVKANVLVYPRIKKGMGLLSNNTGGIRGNGSTAGGTKAAADRSLEKIGTREACSVP